MTHDEALPTTTAEAHRWIARRLLDAHQLVAAYAGRPTGAGQTGAMGGQEHGARWSVQGVEVNYHFGPTLHGNVRVRALVRLAAASATRGAVARLTAALDEWHAVQCALDEQFGLTHWLRPAEVLPTPEYAAWSRREQVARRELEAARQAWWDGQPGIQLDLFGAAS